jgi:phage N-6-adenine-methyltransferase
MKGQDALMSSAKTGGNDGWETPDGLLCLVRAVFDGQIGLDPCTTEKNPCSAKSCLFHPGDGLARSWFAYGGVYVNPPYSRLKDWALKCADEAKAGTEIILLCPARTDTVAFHDYICRADALRLLRGRLTFRGAPSAAPFPSLLAYWGEHEKRFRRAFQPLGWIP